MVSEIFFATKERELKGFTIDNVLFYLAGFFVLLAVAMPFSIRWWYKSHGNYTGLKDLGPVGDFIGGSTIAFFNLASVSLLVATLLIQKRELKETQKEYKVTNNTMKIQQFESTFFNMINLHHNILKEIELDERVGRAVIQDMHSRLKKIYFTEVFTEFRNKIIEDIVLGESERLNRISENLYFEDKYKKYKEDKAESFYYHNAGDEIEANKEWEKFIEVLSKGEDKEWEELKQKYTNHFRTYKNNPMKCRELLIELVDVKLICSEEKLPEQIIKIREQFFEHPLQDLKLKAFEKLYKDNENLIGHYFRNLYRIMKLIQTNRFADNENDNEEEKRKYRGILRAQLSSNELLMIFYNVVYSEKGKKFKDILYNLNFFDDHLRKEDFIWKNDNEELLKIERARKRI